MNWQRVSAPVRRLSPTLLYVIAGVLALLLVAFVVGGGWRDNADLLSGQEISGSSQTDPTGGKSGQVEPADAANPPGLPAIGKWMISKDGSIAHWLGEVVDGKALREPINVIIVDSLSGSAEEAMRRIETASAAAGYPLRTGHSAGYRALIGGKLFPQLTRGRETAFSNDVFELTNDHGRLFGPYPVRGGWLFTGAFSRERVRLEAPGHAFASFNQARDDFSRKLTLRSEFDLSGFVALDNAIVGQAGIGTGDHDGRATLLRTAGR